MVGHEENIETPQIFEVIPFEQIDDSDKRFYAIDGSYNSEQFYNGLCIATYAAGYICFHRGQPANGSWELIRQVVPDDVFYTYGFGEGPNWKMRILKRGLRELGLSEDMLSIGWQRGYYRCTLAENWQEYLLGDANRVVWKIFTQRDLVNYWHERWVAPRLDNLQANLDSCSNQ